MKKINVGDVVKLKSSDIKMTVISVDIDGKSCKVAYFDVSDILHIENPISVECFDIINEVL